MILSNGNPQKIKTIKRDLNKLLKIENYRLPFNAGEYFDTDTNEIKFRINNSEIHFLPEKKKMYLE